jgi:hypothetical protein
MKPPQIKQLIMNKITSTMTKAVDAWTITQKIIPNRNNTLKINIAIPEIFTPLKGFSFVLIIFYIF